MTKPIKIKASQVDNLTDGRFFAAEGVEWLGFPCDPGWGNALSQSSILEISGWLYGPRFVLETGTLSTEAINELVQFTGINNIQTSMELDHSILSPSVESVVREILIKEETDLNALKEEISSGTGIAQFLLKLEGGLASWEYWDKNPARFTAMKNLIGLHSIILEMDYSADNVVHLYETFAPFAISIKGSGESEVGLKTFDEIADVFDRLEGFREE